MHIGELARSAQVNVQTIRFYERQGLLPRPMRSPAGYRCYEARDLERVIFIQRNQELGFTLTEIQELFQLHEAMMARSGRKRRKSDQVQAIITMGRDRLQTINRKIRTLHDMRRNLAVVVKRLESANITTCPVAKSPAKGKRKNLKNSL
jgi:MerR family transcriptional regulator, mercuric resistance operon regulatory protein